MRLLKPKKIVKAIANQYFLFAIIIFCIDQVSKNWAMKAGLVTFNESGAWGLKISDFNLGVFNWNHLLTAVGIVVIVGIGRSVKKWSRVERGWGYLIISAGTSNVIDRVIWGGVRDWLALPLLGMKNNLADIVLTGAIIGLVVAMYNSKRTEKISPMVDNKTKSVAKDKKVRITAHD